MCWSLLNNPKIILAGGVVGLALLIMFGLFSSDVELEYSELAVEAEAVVEVEAVIEEELADFEPTKIDLDMKCNPEIDTNVDL